MSHSPGGGLPEADACRGSADCSPVPAGEPRGVYLGTSLRGGSWPWLQVLSAPRGARVEGVWVRGVALSGFTRDGDCVPYLLALL